MPDKKLYRAAYDSKDERVVIAKTGQVPKGIYQNITMVWLTNTEAIELGEFAKSNSEKFAEIVLEILEASMTTTYPN